jgi:hypothetical protein
LRFGNPELGSGVGVHDEHFVGLLEVDGLDLRVAGDRERAPPQAVRIHSVGSGQGPVEHNHACIVLIRYAVETSRAIGRGLPHKDACVRSAHPLQGHHGIAAERTHDERSSGLLLDRAAEDAFHRRAARVRLHGKQFLPGNDVEAHVDRIDHAGDG